MLILTAAYSSTAYSVILVMRMQSVFTPAADNDRLQLLAAIAYTTVNILYLEQKEHYWLLVLDNVSLCLTRFQNVIVMRRRMSNASLFLFLLFLFCFKLQCKYRKLPI